MVEILSAVLLLSGSFFILIAGIGVVRFPDIYLRMSATTKAATFGAGFTLLAAALEFDDLGVSMRAVATIFFIFLTAPIAAHVIGRAAYLNKIPLWEKSVCDQMKDMYSPHSRKLASSKENLDKLHKQAGADE